MLKFLFVVAFCCLGVIATEDSVAMESETRYQKVKRFHPERESDIDGYRVRPGKKFIRVKLDKGRRNLVHREREARGQEGESSWTPYHRQELRGPVYELPQGFDPDEKYFEEPKHRYQQVEIQNEREVPYVAVQKASKAEGETMKLESSSNPGLPSGSYLNHIKEQMNEGKLLGYSSFVEHFSENDDAEELKTAMREGSLEDIKKLVPKSAVSFQMYHGGEEQKIYKTEPIAERKPEISWNKLNDWHESSSTPQTPPQYVRSVPHKTIVIPERKKKVKKYQERFRPTYHYQTEESREEVQTATASEPPKISSNEVYGKETYSQIIPSISYEIPSQIFKGDGDYETVNSEVTREHDRQEPQASYHSYAHDSEHASWTPVGEKPTSSQSAIDQHRTLAGLYSTPKPPETAKLYYEHFKNTKNGNQETSRYSQLPKVGQIVETSQQSQIPETYYLKKPLRIKSTMLGKRPVTPSLPSGEDFNQHFAQIPTSNPPSAKNVTPQPTRYWSKSDTANYQTQKRLSTPIKLEKILNKQAEVHSPTEKPTKDGSGNIFLTKQFQTEISDFFNTGKSDLEWIPSTQVGFDDRAPSPIAYRASTDIPETQPKPKKYRIYRSERNPGVPGPKNVVFLGPESQQSPGSFSVTASYQIDKNRRSGE